MNAQRKRWALNINDGYEEGVYLSIQLHISIARKRERDNVVLKRSHVPESVREQLQIDGYDLVLGQTMIGIGW